MTNLTERTAPAVKYRLTRALHAKNPVEVLSDIFTKLQDPDLDEMVLYHYIQAMQAQLVDLKHERTPGDAGFHFYQKSAIQAGFVKMMMTIAQDSRTDQWHGLSSYFAMNSMWGLMRAGTIHERRELLHEMLDNNALQISISKIDHPLAIHRNVGLETLRCLATESFLGETMSSMQMADLIVKLCQHILSGHEFYSKQFYAEETTWQSFVCFGSFGHPKVKARKYGPRYFAMTQEKAAFTIQGLLMTSPSPGQNFYAKIIEHRPDIVGLMLKCAALPRFPWYPESQVDQLLSESLVLLIRVPRGHIPGLNIPIEDDVSLWLSGEWDLVRKTAHLLLDSGGAIGQLIEVWNTVEDETTENIEKMVNKVTDYFARAIPDDEDMASIFEYRGAIRVSVERIIATITSVISDEKNLPTKELLSFLRITHQALRPKLQSEGDITTSKDEYYAIETEFECFRPPQYTVVCPDNTVAVEMQVADEATIGPTAHARVLTLLAQRGVLEDIARDRPSLPKGAWTTRLTRPALRQMTSPAALRKFAALGRQRVTERKDEGTRRFKEDNDTEFACVAYFTAAELAAALIAFDDATKGAYSSDLGGVRKDLVSCLGNAAQMMIHMGSLHRGQCYAVAAVEYVKNLPKGNHPDAVSAQIREKNRRRLETCRKNRQTFFEHFMQNRI